MSVIGKVVTRHFSLPVRYCIVTTKQKVSTVFNRKLSYDYFLQYKLRIHRVPLVVNRNFCHNTMKDKAMGALSPLDPSSYSRPEFAVIKHINLTYDVDFDNKILYGNALYNIKVLDYVQDLIFDTSDLSIESLELDDGTPLSYKLDEPVQNFGSKLTITLPLAVVPEKDFSPFDKRNMTKKECERAMKDDPTEKIPMTFNGFAYKPRTPCFYTYDVEESSCERIDLEEISERCIQFKIVQNPLKNFLKSNNMLAIRIKFASAPTATGLQWLEPNQTAGKEHPYLFSQCQPIHARSIIPCQDTPAVKFTYQAEVTAPEHFTVLMSALRTKGEGNRTTFDQPVPIPSYLLAIAVGVLENRKLGHRSIVWAEKEEIENAAWEFAETEKYLKAAEQLCGPYQWKQYDLLVLPPSFPYGGMENPCLTFVTPTLLAGDRSQADVIVHEIMHSWTGNLVTNRNFEHFWLNEGFTVFLERKVAASLQQDLTKAQQTRDFSSLLGLQELDETIHNELGDDSPFTRLIINLDGKSPDDAFSRVPYEKGSLFLRYLEELVGGPDLFEGFIRSYLNKFQRQSIDTFQFKDHFLEYFKNNENISSIDWDTWLYKTGMPSLCFCDSFDRSMTDSVQVIVGKVNDEECSILNYSDVRRFSPQQLIYLLQTLIEQEPLSLERLRDMGEIYRIDVNRNSEIEFRWLRLCVRSKDETQLDNALQFVNKQGRMKYVRPLYRDLYAWEEVRERVIENFLKNEPFMMHVTAYMLRKDLHLSE